MTLMTSGLIQRQVWRPFHKTSSKIVSKGGLGAGIDAQLPKGNTLKVTTVVFSNEVCSNFTAMSSRTLLSSHVGGWVGSQSRTGRFWEEKNIFDPLTFHSLSYCLCPLHHSKTEGSENRILTIFVAQTKKKPPRNWEILILKGFWIFCYQILSGSFLLWFYSHKWPLHISDIYMSIFRSSYIQGCFTAACGVMPCEKHD